MSSDDYHSKASPPRILHLIHWLNAGGIETWLLALLQNVPRDDFAMDVCYKGPREGDLAPQARATGAKFVHCPLGPAVFPFIRRLQQVLVRGRYSLLHVHTHAHSGPAVYAANLVGIPVVTTFHNTAHPPETTLTRLPVLCSVRKAYAQWSMRYALQNSSISNGVSKAVAESVTSSAGLTHMYCDAFYLGCTRPQQISEERAPAYRKELNLPCGARVIIHVGSLKPQKNHEGLLQVFRKVVDAVPDTSLLLVGDGPLRPAVQNQVGRLGLDRHVRFLGRRRDATALMQMADLFLFPSHHEGLSIALMEANAVGLPIVASDIPGNREATEDGHSARLHDVTDIDGMAASVVELLHNPAERRRLGENGQKTYESNFSIEASITRLTALYDDVLHTCPQYRAMHQQAA